MNLNQIEIKIGQRWKGNDSGRIKTVENVSPAGMVLLLNGRMKNEVRENTLRSNYTLLD